RLVGGVYAANTVGAIVGAIGASLILVPWRGTQQAQQILIGISSAAAMLAVLPYLWRGRLRVARIAVAFAALAGIAASAFWLVGNVPALPWQLVAFGRTLPEKIHEDYWQFEYVGEGLNSSVAVTNYGGSVLNFHVSGKVEASSDYRDMRLQR